VATIARHLICKTVLDALLKFFAWGHPTISACDQVNVDGVYETEHHQGGSVTIFNGPTIAAQIIVLSPPDAI
jgi:hypothetical protein